jgi:hypothetical protein
VDVFPSRAQLAKRSGRLKAHLSDTIPVMKTTIARSVSVIMILLLLAAAPQSWATCGGRGGGGMGGMSSGSAPTEQVYHVPGG